MTGVRLRATDGEATREVPADGMFVAIGHDPATKLFAGQLELLEGGYIRIEPGTTRTSVEGVYAAGDCAEFVYRQAVVAAGMGCMAALEAARLLAEEDHDRAHHHMSHQEAKKIAAW